MYTFSSVRGTESAREGLHERVWRGEMTSAILWSIRGGSGLHLSFAQSLPCTTRLLSQKTRWDEKCESLEPGWLSWWWRDVFIMVRSGLVQEYYGTIVRRGTATKKSFPSISPDPNSNLAVLPAPHPAKRIRIKNPARSHGKTRYGYVTMRLWVTVYRVLPSRIFNIQAAPNKKTAHKTITVYIKTNWQHLHRKALVRPLSC